MSGVLRTLAKIQSHQGQYQWAINNIHKAIELEPSNELQANFLERIVMDYSQHLKHKSWGLFKVNQYHELGLVVEQHRQLLMAHRGRPRVAQYAAVSVIKTYNLLAKESTMTLRDYEQAEEYSNRAVEILNAFAPPLAEYQPNQAGIVGEVKYIYLSKLRLLKGYSRELHYLDKSDVERRMEIKEKIQSNLATLSSLNERYENYKDAIPSKWRDEYDEWMSEWGNPGAPGRFYSLDVSFLTGSLGVMLIAIALMMVLKSLFPRLSFKVRMMASIAAIAWMVHYSVAAVWIYSLGVISMIIIIRTNHPSIKPDDY